MKSFLLSTMLVILFALSISGCGGGHEKLGEAVDASFSADSNQQVIEIKINHGYQPNNIVARTGVPLTLIFGKSDGSCAREVEIPEFDVKETLSSEKNTTVNILSEEAKVVPFHCSMKMMHGQIEFVAPSE